MENRHRNPKIRTLRLNEVHFLLTMIGSAKLKGVDMLKKLITVTLFLALATPLAWADNVTVHNTIGLLEAQLVTKAFEQVGTVEVWNTSENFNIVVTPFSDRCTLSKVYVYLSSVPAPPPGKKQVDPNFGEWPYSMNYKTPPEKPYALNIGLADLQFEWGQWGVPYLEQRVRTVAVFVELKTLDVRPVVFSAWAMNPNVPLDVQRTAWGDNAFAMRYELQHPKQGNFVGPVHGLRYETPTHSGITGEQSGFSFYPGEDISFWIPGPEPGTDTYIGTGKADQRVSPLDLFPGLDISDPPVLSIACLLLGLDTSDTPSGALEIPQVDLGRAEIDFTTCEDLDDLGLPDDFSSVSDELALAWLEQAIGNSVFRRNVSKSPDYAVDKPKLDIIPVWVPARTASGGETTVEYKDKDGNPLETRDKVKPLVVTYTEEQDNSNKGLRRASDIITAVSMDDGATWKRFNVSHMAEHSSFTLKTTGESFPGNCRSPQQKIAEDKILVVWTSAYARGGKPRVAIKTTDDYPYDDAYAVRDLYGVRGRQGSVDYDLDDDVADQGIGEIPYYALWACRGVLVWEGNAGKYPGHDIGDIVWFKPERLTTARRDAFIPVVGSAKNVGFGIAWQEDPGGLRPGKCSAGGHGWSGATVHKKTDIWYSFLPYADFELIDTHFVAADHSADEHAADLGGDSHSQQPEISSRPKWLVPMSLPVRVSDNNTVNTENMRVELDEVTGLPLVENGSFIPLVGAEEEDWVAHEKEHDATCGGGEGDLTDEEAHDGEGGTGGGWGMARYAYMLDNLGPLADTSGTNAVWDATVLGEYRPGEMEGARWYRFINQPGRVKTVVITPDDRVLDGDTGACRPNLTLMPGGWALLGYEETKGLGEPPEDEDHHSVETVDTLVALSSYDEDDEESGDKGKDVIYHAFKFDQPEAISAGHVVNLPALDDTGNLIPIYYKDAEGADTGVLRQYATENARRVRFIAQPKPDMLKTPGADTVAVVLYKQGREGNGKPSDIFAVRVVVPTAELNSTSKANPYRFDNFMRYDAGAEASTPGAMQFQRRHMNMTSATVEAQDPLDIVEDYEGNGYGRVLMWKQYGNDLSDESFANPYSDAKGHRGFIRGDKVVLGYSFTPNWGRLGGDHLDFFVRRSFDGGRTWTTDPNGPEETVHTVIEKNPTTKEYTEKQYRYRRGEFEPGRNVSLLKGNRYTVTDPRLVPPMGPGTVNPTYSEDDTYDPDVYYVAFGTAEVIHGIADPRTTDTVKADIFYTRTTDAGSTWLMEPWVINPDSASPEAGETVYRFPWLAQGTPHQGHAQMRMHPSGTRFYAIWHQFTDGDDAHVSPHDVGNDIWFRRIDFMKME